MAESGNYEVVIGLEIHVQLKTKTKMFCSCSLSFGDEPNIHTCPVCLGHPGTLPVLNEKAVKYGLMIAEALECEPASRSIFHRKNYFYPDLPKGYQISQFDVPLASSGRLGDVRIHRVHLEEDAAKLIHESESGRIHGSGSSLVDFNRGGTPLAEIVSEPDLRSAAEAKDWLRLLKATLAQTGVSDCNMEEGSLRCDANVSIRDVGEEVLGTKTELKNMNSFRFLERGIEAEVIRQKEIIQSGGEVEQETLHFDPASGSLTTLRSKEEAHDYRYFPEPDLVPLVPTKEMLREVREELPELPEARRERLVSEQGLSKEAAQSLTMSSELGDFFDKSIASAGTDGKRPSSQGLANWIVGELVARLRDEGIEDPGKSKVRPESITALVGMVEAGEVTGSAGKEVLAEMVKEGGDPDEIVGRRGLGSISDAGELESIVEKVISENKDAAEQFKAGKQQAIGSIVGAVMKETKGRADGKLVKEMIKEKLAE